jgi:hypothetical protein
MRTLVAMVSSGPRGHLTDYSFPRASKWAARHGYNAILIKDSLQGPNRPPHYGKLLVPEAFPGFDRYCVIDDDLLMNTTAPALPEIPSDCVGLAKDAEQRNTRRQGVEWTGNTGFILCPSAASHLLKEAYEGGDDPEIWGIADQGALNSVLWKRRKIAELDGRWNLAPVLDFFVQGRGWDAWLNSKPYRLSYYLGIATGIRWHRKAMLKHCWGCHLIRAPYPRFFSSYLP